MKINVKGHIRDLLAFRRLVPTRQKRFARASAEPLGLDPMNRLAQQLHPDRQQLVIAEIRDETKTTKTFKLVPDPGSEIVSSGPCGQFYYEPMRDADKIVGLVGGSGITPFRSMAREIVYGELDAELLLLYGSSDEDDIVYYEQFKELEERAPGKVRVVHVLSCEEVTLEGCEQGFITSDTIAKYADVGNSSFLICGPQVMYDFVDKELATFDLPPKRIRREVLGQAKDITQSPGFPQDMTGETFRLTVQIGSVKTEVPAQATETVLVAMERANLAPPSECRSGECGFCRSQLISGEVYINPDADGRRAADKQFGYIHPCSSYPLTDLELVVARGE
jgi:ferredoxin-NADP reductase